MIKQLDNLFNYRNLLGIKLLKHGMTRTSCHLLWKTRCIAQMNTKLLLACAIKMHWQYTRSSRVLQLTVNDLAKAWKNYFNQAMPNHDKPKFKSRKRSKKSFKTDRAKIVNGKLRLDKPRGSEGAWFDIPMIESVRFEGALKLTTVKQEVRDGYYASLSIEVDETPVTRDNKVITGVDVNIRKFDYKTKDGYAIQETLPISLIELYQKITHYQRMLARKRVANFNRFNSNNYRITRTKLKRAYQEVYRIQEDLLHKFTAQLVKDNDVVVIEDLDNNHMKMNKRLAKNLHRSLFGRFKPFAV